MNQSSLLDLGLWPEGSYEIGSVPPMSVQEFSRNLIISFSNFWHGNRKLYTKLDFSKKKTHCPENWQKRSKMDPK